MKSLKEISDIYLIRSMEKHIESKKWALTLTLKPEWTDKLTHQEQYNLAVPNLLTLLSNIKCFKNTLLVMELTKKNNLHFHMLIETDISYMVKFVRYVLDIIFKDTIFGYYFLRFVEDEAGWIHYMNKNPYYYEKYAYTH